jgi:hypothetical protein
MSDVALTNAMARMKEIQRWISERERELERISNGIRIARQDLEKTHSFIRTWHEMAGIPLPRDLEQDEPMASLASPRRPKNPDREFIVDKSLEIIRSHGVPMARRELYESLIRRGVIINGKDPEMVLSTMLWRTKEKIVRLPPYGYWPADEAYPPAHYDPRIDDMIGAAANEPEGGIEADDA